MSKKDKKEKKPKKEVYILQATYKDNDPETIGAYDSMQAMMRGFAKSITQDVLSDNIGVKFDKVAMMLAVTLADLIPAFFDDNYPRDEDGCIRCEKTTYGYETMEVESVEEENEEDENEEVKEG